MKKRVTVQMEEDLDYRLEVSAALLGKGKNELVSIALKEYLSTQPGYKEACKLIKQFKKR